MALRGLSKTGVNRSRQNFGKLLRFFLGVCGSALGKSYLDNTKHFVARRRLASPDFKLARRLMDKHLASGNHLRSSFFGQSQEFRLGRIIDHVEHILRLDLIGVERRFTCISHSHRSGVDDDVEVEPFQIGPLDRTCLGLTRQLLRRRQAPVQYKNLSAAFP